MLEPIVHTTVVVVVSLTNLRQLFDAAPSPSQITHLSNALAALPEVERPALIEHVKALARLSSAKRAAVLTRVADDG